MPKNPLTKEEGNDLRKTMFDSLDFIEQVVHKVLENAELCEICYGKFSTHWTVCFMHLCVEMDIYVDDLVEGVDNA